LTFVVEYTTAEITEGNPTVSKHGSLPVHGNLFQTGYRTWRLEFPRTNTPNDSAGWLQGKMDFLTPEVGSMFT
jgi:hypothetical protein